VPGCCGLTKKYGDKIAKKELKKYMFHCISGIFFERLSDNQLFK
jgi:hypothetical protein